MHQLEDPIKVFSLDNHSLYLCSENGQLGKSVIITTNLNKSKVTQYKEELLYIITLMSLENLLNQYQIFNEFIEDYLPQRDIQLIRRKDGLHVALLCSYFLKKLQINLIDVFSILQALEIENLEKNYMESLEAFERSLKPKFKIKIQEILPESDRKKFQQVESWISVNSQHESQLAQSVVMSQAVFEERLIEIPNFSRILKTEDYAKSEYIP